MKYTQGKYPVVSKTAIAKEIYDFEIFCPEIAEIAKVGQFVNIKAEGFSLRRPISICEINREKGTLRVIFEVRGDGTKVISDIPVGGMIDIIAPLGGNGFDLSLGKTAVIIGGGIGTPPMLGVASHFGENSTVISGFRNASAVILQDDFAKTGAETVLCTDDGSAGKKGFVTDALVEVLSSKKVDVIYACGPKMMLQKIADIAKVKDIACQLSLEERMGCGIGACLVCACKTVKDGEEIYSHVCKDGPVFDAREVVLYD